MGSLTLEVSTGGLSRNVGQNSPLYAAQCSRMSADLVYFAAEGLKSCKRNSAVIFAVYMCVVEGKNCRFCSVTSPTVDKRKSSSVDRVLKDESKSSTFVL